MNVKYQSTSLLNSNSMAIIADYSTTVGSDINISSCSSDDNQGQQSYFDRLFNFVIVLKRRYSDDRNQLM